MAGDIKKLSASPGMRRIACSPDFVTGLHLGPIPRDNVKSHQQTIDWIKAESATRFAYKPVPDHPWNKIAGIASDYAAYL